ncbi:unnamed protein product [Rotaria sordida]|uniref:Uncharacterized protein n=1 Tax=Rotaria sordida TaxID=392033 RepID=A0A815HDP3_9BILA|nr:unnamed protein product [Rotaria sordida]CAF1600954.1 unnamed protein product [Rotaria sordida]
MLQLWSSEDLFYKYDSDKALFKQSLLPNLVNNHNDNFYPHLDGFNPNDLSTIEDFIINLNNDHIFWELENLNELSPLFLSSCVMLNIEESIWTWREFLLYEIFQIKHIIMIYMMNYRKILIDYIERIELYNIKDKSTISI